MQFSHSPVSILAGRFYPFHVVIIEMMRQTEEEEKIEAEEEPKKRQISMESHEEFILMNSPACVCVCMNISDRI